MESISCIFCHNRTDYIAIEENSYKGRKCFGCGLIYISPRPSFYEIRNIYSHDDAHVSAEAHISFPYKKRLYARHSIGIIEKYKNHGSILEVGAGAGYFLDEARKKGYGVCAVELNPLQATFIKEKLGIPCYESCLDDCSFGENKFDIIYHCDILSHFYDPIKELNSMRKILKDDAILIFETGNIADMKEVYLKMFETFHYPDHLFFFGENSLARLLNITGFKIVKIHRYSILPHLYVFGSLKRLINLIKSRHTGRTKIDTQTVKNTLSIKVSFKDFLVNTSIYISYFIRYRLGYIMPKKDKPQTLIVIARKQPAA